MVAGRAAAQRRPQREVSEVTSARDRDVDVRRRHRRRHVRARAPGAGHRRGARRPRPRRRARSTTSARARHRDDAAAADRRTRRRCSTSSACSARLSRAQPGVPAEAGRARRGRPGACCAGSRPQVVVTVGGYASFPATFAARPRRIPIVVVSYDRRPGLASKLLARRRRGRRGGLPGLDAAARARSPARRVRQAILDRRPRRATATRPGAALDLPARPLRGRRDRRLARLAGRSTRRSSGLVERPRRPTPISPCTTSSGSASSHRRCPASRRFATASCTT